MAVTAKKFYAGTPTTGSWTTVYTVPSGKQAIIKNITLCNTTGSTATIGIGAATFSIVSSGYSINANDTVVLDLSVVLDAGQTITVTQGTANAIHVHISGVEVT